ncbi:general odorant-binding protein 19d-like [Anastrepha obliqua]|uniref:general odorant-binding protein 19d-like n=1 Tax=Anastrepha ludens TaxID=28586 RepID=UPI0023AEC9FA|nr:general odorant-binding protein 19d-like [Anastrepha ludens]XP_054729483.1 general odorant-binding protein 19d-like [Anastrepha obliqua]
MRFLNIFLILCAAFISYAECHDSEKARAVANECKDEVGATDADVDSMFNHEPAGSSEAKCLHACVMKRFGLLNDEGKMDKEKALDILEKIHGDDEEQQNLGKEVVEACGDIEVDEDHCEAAEEYRMCIHGKAEENGFKLGRV